MPLDPVRVEAAHEAGRPLEALGHHVEEAQAPWRDHSLQRAFTALFAPLVTLQIAFAGSSRPASPSSTRWSR